MEDISIDKLYEYYLYNIHTMINKMGFKYHFAEVWRAKYLSLSQESGKDFSRLSVQNPYLQEYENDKIKLAEDILENGMYCPFFGGQLDNKIDPSIYFIAQGKHRMYALRRYHLTIKPLDKKFLFLDFPYDVQYCLLKDSTDRFKIPIKMYTINTHPKLDVRSLYICSCNGALSIMDDFGGEMTKYIKKLRFKGEKVKAPSVLTDEKLFKNFIDNNPYERCDIL